MTAVSGTALWLFRPHEEVGTTQNGVNKNRLRGPSSVTIRTTDQPALKLAIYFVVMRLLQTSRHEPRYYKQVCRQLSADDTITIQYKICKVPCCRGFRGAGEQDS